MKNWLKNILGKQDPAPANEWRTDQSILEFISSHIDADGKLSKEGEDLPDEKVENEKVRFAAGLTDAMFGVDESKESKERIQELAALFKKIAHGDRSAENQFYDRITGDESVIGIIDEFLEEISKHELPILPYLFAFANDLATRSAHRNAVKFGIAVLGVCQDNSVLPDIKMLGLHDEFTVFATVAITSLSADPVNDLWDQARKVDGWGKIQTVERLVMMELTDEIRDWLVRDGYRNSIMYEYLAYTCAMHGNLHERLEAESIDPQLFYAAGEIIQALIAGGPAEDMTCFEYAAATVEGYIRHASTHAESLQDYFVLLRLKDFLIDLQDDAEENSKNGWTENIISDCLIDITTLINRKDLKPMIMDGMRSADDSIYWNAKQVAITSGFDVWDVLWQRLVENPHSSISWYDVTTQMKAGHEDEFIQFAEKTLPLHEYATGPKDSAGFGPNFTKYESLDYVLHFLKHHPRRGESIILAALQSPVTRNRNVAIAALKEWKKENWSNEITVKLTWLKNIEPNSDTKKELEELLEDEQ